MTRTHETRSFESEGALVVWATMESTSAAQQSRVRLRQFPDRRYERRIEKRAVAGSTGNKMSMRRLGTTYGGLCEATEGGMVYIAMRNA